MSSTIDPLMAHALQEMNEKRFNRRHIDEKIRAWFKDSLAVQSKIELGTQLVTDYMNKTYSYESKNKRVAQLQGMDTKSLVTSLFVGIAYMLKPELYTSVTAMLAGRLCWDDKPAAITTMAEIVAVLTDTDAFDIVKEGKYASLMIWSKFEIPDTLRDFIANSLYLPPMVVKPRKLKTNMSSGYLTHNDSLILGKGNHHDGNTCLDVLNTMNSVQLSLNTEFISTYEEDPSEVTIATIKAKAMEKGSIISDGEAEERLQAFKDNWITFKRQSYNFYHLMATQGNEFYLTHKVDKRGRIYSQGYHINTQGTAFKKACIDFYNKEIIDIPSGFFS